MDYRDMMQSHILWIADLWDTIHKGEHVDPNEIGRDDKCELGKWLNDDTLHYNENPNFQKLKELHSNFHGCVKKAVMNLDSSSDEVRLLELEDHGECQDISHELLQAARALLEDIDAHEKK